MQRVLVTGNAGSGKTTFARIVTKELNIPSYGLDSVVWKSGWIKTPDEEKREKIQKLIDLETWIIDGVSGQAFRAADAVFFLDIPLYRCIFNILRRFFSGGLKTRESLPENCPEYIGVFKALRITFIYQMQTRPFILSLIEANPQKKILWVKSYTQLRELSSIF